MRDAVSGKCMGCAIVHVAALQPYDGALGRV